MLSKIREGFINLMHLMRIVFQKGNFKVITYLLSAKGPESQCLKHFKIHTSFQAKGIKLPIFMSNYCSFVIVLDSDQLLSFFLQLLGFVFQLKGTRNTRRQ